MKSNSDDSDYEDKSFENQDNDKSLEEKKTYSSFFNEDGCNSRKRHYTLSDSSDSEDSEDSYDKKDNIKLSSHNLYKDLSCKQDAHGECSNQNTHDEPIHDRELNSQEEMKETNVLDTSYEDTFRFTKRQKLQRNKKKSDKDDIDNEKDCTKQEPGNSQDKVQRMMKMMGYKEGHGLGKNKQGRLEPVEAAKQHGRWGIGHHVPQLEASGLKWDPEEEDVKVIEDMEWIKCPEDNLPILMEMQNWLHTGVKKMSIDDEFDFCDESIVKNVVASKSVYDDIDNAEMQAAKIRCNPYETIRGAIFLNRAAVKMANIDKVCDFMFTNPKCLGHNELLYFADVCAGPGGFSEYVLWRKKWHAKGFGLTLKNECDFKLDDFLAGPCETFHPYYGPKDNGDVYDPVNQEAFKNLIMEHTHGKGVHFMMSDGGFSVKGQETLQEILSKQLYLCQCLMALMIVREKGHYVTKLFDLFTPFSAGVLYLMYRCFEEICIFKPNTSRPANSERYLICKSKRLGTEDVIQYFKGINNILLRGEDNNDVLQLVSYEELEREKQFVQYLRKSNCTLGKKQITGLRKIAAFCSNSSLVEVRQSEMRKECLAYWELPSDSRAISRAMKPQARISSLLETGSFPFSSNPKELTSNNVGDTILNVPYNWFCMPCGTGRSTEELKNATFYFGMGRSKVYRYTKRSWSYVSDLNLELPADTLVYAEVVYEMIKEFKHQQKVLALHILDAVFLGGENVGEKYLRDRHKLIKKFCDALWKPAGSNCTRIRAKDLLPVKSNICQKLKVTQRTMKNGRPSLVYEQSDTSLDPFASDGAKSYFSLNSVMFLKSIAYPWGRHYSKRNSQMYVFNSKTGKPFYDTERPDSAEARFMESFDNRVIWYWPNNDSLTMETFSELIEKKCSPYDQNLNY